MLFLMYMLYPDYILKGSKTEIWENMKDEFLHWVETDILPIKQLASETLQDSTISKIVSRIKINKWNNCSKAERAYKEIKYKLTVENGVYNGDLLVPSEKYRKDVMKMVHDNVFCWITATQKCLKLETWPGCNWKSCTQMSEMCWNKTFSSE